MSTHLYRWWIQDQTLEIINASLNNGDILVSEPDNGIYDAMNKGIALADGEIVGVLNADDFYSHSKVLTEVLKAFNDQSIDACYADLQYVSRQIQQKLCKTLEVWNL